LRADQGQRSAPNRRNRRLDPHSTAICSIRRASIVGPQEPQVAAFLGKGCDSRHFPTLEKINKINVLNGVLAPRRGIRKSFHSKDLHVPTLEISLAVSQGATANVPT
jgi:hypothetical protein